MNEEPLSNQTPEAAPDVAAAVGPGAQTLSVLRGLAHAGLVALLALFVFLFFTRGAPYDEAWRLVLEQLSGGRAGAASYGFEQHFPPMYLFGQLFAVDAILALYLYTWFIILYRMLLRVPALGSLAGALHGMLLRHRGAISLYAVPALVLAVLFPFWGAGCLTAVVAGAVLGIPAWLLLPSLALADAAAIAGWIWAYERIQQWSPVWVSLFLAGVFALFVAVLIFRRWRKIRAARMTEWENAPAPAGENTGFNPAIPPEPERSAPAPEAAGADTPRNEAETTGETVPTVRPIDDED